MHHAATSNPLALIAAAPFLIAWIVGLAAWLLCMGEIGAIYLLRDIFFERGLIALRREVELSPPSSPALGQSTRLNQSHIRFTNPTRAIFASRYTWSHVGWPVKGVISWFGSRAEVSVRHPLGLTIFILAWLTGWISGTAAVVYFTRDTQDLFVGIPLSLIGGLGGYVLYRLFLSRSRKTADFIADEVLSHLRL